MNYRKSTTLPPISHLGNNNDINTVRYFLLKAFVTVGFNEHHVAILFFFSALKSEQISDVLAHPGGSTKYGRRYN